MFFQIYAIVTLCIFYGCYFVKAFRQKREGIKTNQVGKGKTGFVKRVEITMTVAAVLVPVAEIVSILLNTSALPLPFRCLGAVLALIGDGIFVCAVLTMRDSWRVGTSTNEQTTLITDGIYKFSRNPAFLGFDLLYLGMVCMFFNWFLFALSVFAAIMFHLQIVNGEEDYLLVTFGEEYLKYKKKVNRYFGRKRNR